MIGLPEDKVIITVAQTGALVTKSMNPSLPEQPQEIAESAHACYSEGAAICHIHARDKEGKTTGSKEGFQPSSRSMTEFAPSAISSFRTPRAVAPISPLNNASNVSTPNRRWPLLTWAV